MSDAQDEQRRHHGNHGHHPKDDDHKHRRKKQQEMRDPKQVIFVFLDKYFNRFPSSTLMSLQTKLRVM